MPWDQGPNYTPTDGVPVVLTSTDFDLTVQFPGQKYASRLAVGGSGNLTVTFLSGRNVTYTVTTTNNAPVFITGLFTKVVRATTTATLIIAEQ